MRAPQDGSVALRRRTSSLYTKQEGKTAQAPWKILQTGHTEFFRMASERAGGAGRVGRSVNATVPVAIRPLSS
jgi:hypothetical protein